MRSIFALFVGLLSIALIGCSALGGGENSGPEATITFENATDSPVVFLVAPTRQTPEERFSTGFPRVDAALPNTEFSVALIPTDFDSGPLCETMTYYFYHLRDSEIVWAPWDDESQSFDDLVLIETLADPCWESENAAFTITGDA